MSAVRAVKLIVGPVCLQVGDRARTERFQVASEHHRTSQAEPQERQRAAVGVAGASDVKGDETTHT